MEEEHPLFEYVKLLREGRYRKGKQGLEIRLKSPQTNTPRIEITSGMTVDFLIAQVETNFTQQRM